jgi:hypothetical protein
MFTREEASRMRQSFWTTLGKYMSPIPSAEGQKVNWINYHTRVKDVYFRMEAGAKSASISISIEHRDPGIQELYFEQFLQMKQMLHSILAEEWQWQLHHITDEKVVSRIFTEIEGVSIFRKDDWAELISFFKPRMIALDAFWENAKYTFDDLK